MSDLSLAQAVKHFAQVTQGASTADLERPWAWGAFDDEGVRFAFFRTYEELRELAVRIVAERAEQRRLVTQAQRILTCYHVAYRELQALLLGLTGESLHQPPAEGEWPVQQTVAHIIKAATGFYASIRHGLDVHRAGAALPDSLTRMVWTQGAAFPDYLSRVVWAKLVALDEIAFKAVMQGPFDGLQHYHAEFHQRILSEFSVLGDEDLELPSVYWEPTPMPIRFRLHRFDSHTRQHTVQIEKTLLAIGQAPSEARMLLRLIYAALGEVEGMCFGAPGIGDVLIHQTAQTIFSRADDLAHILAG